MKAMFIVYNQSYNEEIADLLDAMPPVAAGPEAVPAAGQEALTSHVRIAPRKKSAVMRVLNAIYKAGWLVDEEGKRLTNRNTALRQILRSAFGIDCNHIDQLLNPSNNPDNAAKAKEELQELIKLFN